MAPPARARFHALVLRCALCDSELEPADAIGCGGCGATLHGACARQGCPTLTCRAGSVRRPGPITERLQGKLLTAAFGFVALWVVSSQFRSNVPLHGVDSGRLVAEARALLERTAGPRRVLTAADLATAPYVRHVAHGEVVATERALVVRIGATPDGAAVIVHLADEGGSYPAPTTAELDALDPRPDGVMGHFEPFERGAELHLFTTR